MKKNISILLFLFTFGTITLTAQLRVVHSGRVAIENNLSVSPDTVSDTVPAIHILSTALFTKSAYGIYSKAWYQKNPAGGNYAIGNKVIGVYGSSEDNLIPLNHTSTPPFNAGIAGTSDKGVGVYGAITDTFPIFNPGQYAGYFMGNTKVVGSLTCTSLSQTSDALTKNNVQYLREDITKRLLQLKPVSFYYNLDNNLFNAMDIESPAAQQMHYGFMAQELQETLPDIVYMGQDSILSINYIELIPLLIRSIQDLQEQIEALERRITEYEISHNNLQVSPNKVVKNFDSHNISEYVLFQNTPNPFSQDTRIEYIIPLETREAKLYIYDANGLQLEFYPITEFGKNSLTISGGHLPAGIYLYSLIADDKIIDTKRMILTK